MCKRFERMMKCLELSASPNDAEALAAIRAANKIREELGLKWSDFANPNPGEQDWIKDLARKWRPSENEEENERQRKEQAAEENAAYQKYQREAQLKEEREARKREEWRTRFPELQEDEGYS
jgi:hypothetical protein